MGAYVYTAVCCGGCLASHIAPVSTPYKEVVCSFLPENTSILGYARSKLSKEDLRNKVRPNLKGADEDIDEFLDKLDYQSGPYDKAEGYQEVCIIN